MTRTLAPTAVALLAAAALAVAAAPSQGSIVSYSAGKYGLEIDGIKNGYFRDATFGDRTIVLRGGTAPAALTAWLAGEKRQDPDVVLYSASGTPLARYHLESALVVNREANTYSLDASKNEISIETLEIAHQGVRPA